ncbi:helix-turn-helix domain-containing protein [Bacteroidota bacterium]
MNKLHIITKSLKAEYQKFDFYTLLVIRSLIVDLLVELPDKKWDVISKDSRILNILKIVERDLKQDLSNDVLAARSNLATNAFNRLFKTEVGISPQKYIRKKRIDKACALLDHSKDSIDVIADETGFADRYHFSKIFKQVIGISPGKYRKEFNV